jgi:hypothetical protein
VIVGFYAEAEIKTFFFGVNRGTLTTIRVASPELRKITQQQDKSMSNSQNLQVTQRSKIKRLPKRGSQERELIYNILDEALVAHVGNKK